VLGAARATHAADLFGGLLAGRKYYRGTLRRVEKSAVPFKVIVSGQGTTLPAVHVKGTVAVRGDVLMKIDLRSTSLENAQALMTIAINRVAWPPKT